MKTGEVWSNLNRDEWYQYKDWPNSRKFFKWNGEFDENKTLNDLNMYIGKLNITRTFKIVETLN